MAALSASFAFAQQALEIIQLRHQTVEEVLPALQPLLEPGGTLSGSRGQLILRASPPNAVEIKRALQAIDRPRAPAEDAWRAATERVDQRRQVLEADSLEILHQRPTQAGAAKVGAELGEWVEIAGTVRELAREGARSSEARRIWVKVEELLP